MSTPGGWRARVSGKFERDLLWNLGSFAVLGLSGLALLRLIDELYGAAALGVFGQVWAAYVISSQLAVLGIDRSLLRTLASERGSAGAAVCGALVPGAVLSAAVALAFYALAEPLARMQGSAELALGMRAAAPGLFFFGLNKIALAAVNGARRMRAYAIYQSLRYIGMPLGALAAWGLGLPGARVAVLFSFAEGALALVLALELALATHGARRGWTRHTRTHLSYGLRSALSGMLLELNSRVDVWMLGWFLVDEVPIARYVAALQVAEGLYQVLVVLQSNYNPLLAQLWGEGQRAELETLVRRGRRVTWIGMGALCALACACYPWVVRLWMGDDYAASFAPFACLMAGIALASGYQPFQQLLLMANRPGWHSAYMGAVVGINVLANALLIPRLGSTGAAIATGIAFLASAALIVLLARRLLGLRL
jgi:O-antigen/teichoic acid export membrane protein